MKKITISIVSVLALSGMAFAGGDLKDVEPVVVPVVEIEEVDDSSFYVGLGYSRMTKNVEDAIYVTGNEFDDLEYTADSLLLLAGYNFNKYVAVEGRYTMSIGDVEASDTWYDEADNELSNIGIYLKPMYPIGGLTVYGLLGYGQVTFDNGTEYSESGFQWGLGANYAVTEDVGVFVDYTRLYDDENFDDCMCGDHDVVVDSINVGVTYTF